MCEIKYKSTIDVERRYALLVHDDSLPYRVRLGCIAAEPRIELLASAVAGLPKNERDEVLGRIAELVEVVL